VSPSAGGGGTCCKVRVDLANPYERSDAVIDATALLFDAKAAHCIDTTGVLASVLASSPGRMLGRGVGEKIWGATFGGREFALKTQCADLEHAELADADTEPYLRLLAAEARINEYLTRRLLGVHKPWLARCPHFVAAYAYELTPVVPACVRGKMQSRTLTEQYACVMATECVDMGTAERVLFSVLDPALVDASPLASECTAFSLIAQTLIAICAMAACGVSHNDLYLANVFATSTEMPVLVYEFPGACIATRPRVYLRTFHVLYLVGDFGVASHELWETDGDVRFSETSGADDSGEDDDAKTRAGSLHRFYYTSADVVAERRNGLLTVDAKEKQVHALLYDLSRYERDVAYFLSNVVTTAQTLGESARRVVSFARVLLDEFDVPGRLKDAAQLVDITQRVLSRDFVAGHFGTRTAAAFFFNADEVDAFTHVYALPSRNEALLMRADVHALLNKPVAPHSLVRVVDGGGAPTTTFS